jgi:hypothetical protein
VVASSILELAMQQPFKIIIAGGGTAGWMAAAAISSLYKDRLRFQIVLVESEEIRSVGVGEATLPSIKSFNDQLGISEPEMMRRTHATFKLGIKFVDWGKQGSSYIHPFGLYGNSKNSSEFYQYWARLNRESLLLISPTILLLFSYVKAIDLLFLPKIQRLSKVLFPMLITLMPPCMPGI